MKTTILLLLSLLATSAGAQDDHHAVSDHISHGGFGGPMVRFTELNGQFGLLVGGHGGWVIDSRFVLGAGGYALVGNDVDIPVMGSTGARPYMSFSYGGLEMQYVDHPAAATHILLSLLAGGGNATYHVGNSTQNDGVFVIEPGITFTVHFTRAIHFDIGATYRFVPGVDPPGTGDPNFSGFTGMVGFDFGHF